MVSARVVDRVVDGVAVAAFSGMFLCVLAQVVFRYFLGEPLTWSDELARYLFVWASFLGWIVAARRRSHLAIDMAATRLSSGDNWICSYGPGSPSVPRAAPERSTQVNCAAAVSVRR